MISIVNNNAASQVATQLSSHYGALTSSVRRLATGLRINSASDDAAGLAIRELMRSEISGLFQGARNANDAISLLQVADGSLAIIDEKLIRMKELAEQAATGTYTSTQRLVIHSEFQAMASEIDRIANATDFNGIKLLNGSLSGAHDGSGLVSKGSLKIHFGSANDSAEDYYYIKIGDCSTRGLGLRDSSGKAQIENGAELRYEDIISYPPFSELNDYKTYTQTAHGRNPFDISTLQEGVWYCGTREGDGDGSQNTMLLIKKGTKNFVLNEIGTTYGTSADNDIQLFTTDGKHLAGRSPLPDYDSFPRADPDQPTDLASNCAYMGFTIDQYDAQYLNSGATDQNNGATMRFTSYNGMTIGYSGDGPKEYDNIARYEVLAIDEVTEDLVAWLPGVAGAVFKYYIGESSWEAVGMPPGETLDDGVMMSIDTQEKAQKALERISDAMVYKDKARAHIGALQNRFENTVTSLNIQSENLKAAESRISDAEIALEMTSFVRNQIFAQASIAMLSQANSSANLIASLITS